MKTYFLSAVVLFFIISQGCKKNAPVHTTLSGKWKRISTSGGLAGVHITYGIDSVYTLQLDKDSTYSLAFNNQEKESGKYSLSITTSATSRDTFMLFIRGVDTVRDLMQRRNGNLYLGDNAADGFIDEYKAIGQ